MLIYNQKNNTGGKYMNYLFYHTTIKCNRDNTVNYCPIEMSNVETYEEVEELLNGDANWKREAADKIMNRLYERNKRCAFITHKDGSIEVFFKAELYESVLEVVRDLRTFAIYVKIQKFVYGDKIIGSF